MARNISPPPSRQSLSYPASLNRSVRLAAGNLSRAEAKHNILRKGPQFYFLTVIQQGIVLPATDTVLITRVLDLVMPGEINSACNNPQPSTKARAGAGIIA